MMNLESTTEGNKPDRVKQILISLICGILKSQFKETESVGDCQGLGGQGKSGKRDA